MKPENILMGMMLAFLLFMINAYVFSAIYYYSSNIDMLKITAILLSIGFFVLVLT